MFDILKDALEWLIDQFWAGMGELFEGLLGLIPNPEFVAKAREYVLAAANYLDYPMYLIGMDVGIPMVFGAMLIRFFIRRLPMLN